MLSEMSDRERQISDDFTYIWNLKSKVNEKAEQKTDSQVQRTF